MSRHLYRDTLLDASADEIADGVLRKSCRTRPGALMVLSFTATTVGYGGAAWYVAHAVVRTVH